MTQMISRNLFRTIILILAAGLIIAVIYALSFTSFGAASIQGEIRGDGQGAGQFQTAPEGADFQTNQGAGFGQGTGFGNEHLGGGQGFRRGLGEGRGGEGEFSLIQGSTETVINLIVIAILIVIVSFLQGLAKRRRRVSAAT